MPGTGMGAGPSRARMDSTHHGKGSTPGAGRGGVHIFGTLPGAAVGSSPSMQATRDMGQESESDTDQTSEDVSPSNLMPPQDEIMYSPTPKPWTTPTVTPQAASPSMWSNMHPEDDVNMGSPMSEKSAPAARQLPPPLPSLLSVIESQPTTSANQAAQLPSTSTSAAPAKGLLHNSYLDSLNLAVNAEFDFLTCQICQTALGADDVKQHLTKMHGTQSRYKDDLFKLAISALKQHPNMPKPTSWWHCKIQQLGPGPGHVQSFWEVESIQDGSGPTLHQSLVDSLLKELEPTRQVIQTPLDGRMVSPWLLTTQWHEHMAGKDIKKLCSLVALPKNNDGDIPGLRDAVEAYYEEALSLLDRTGELVLQRLNSPDPMKSGISNTPFHKHLHKATMKQYILPVVALLAMLIRQEYSGKPFSGSNPRLMDLLAVLHIDDPQGRDALHLIHELLLEVWTTAWTHDGDGDIVDPTEWCLALMMLRQDGAFKEPQEVTPVIARFQYCMHLTFLQEIHHRLESDPDSDELEHCMDLENFFVEKRCFTFSHLCSLQHRASSLAYDTMSLPQVWWTDTRTWKSMLFRGEQVNFADICKVFEQTEAKLVQIWEEVILMGQDIRVEYDRIADDLVSKDMGYSFLSDARNPQLTHQDQLLRKFLQDEDIFSHFAMIWENAIVWNRSTLQAWLRSYAELQSLLLLRAQMLSGVPTRGTELTAMTYRNIQAWPTRNLVVLGKHVSLLCQYLKTTALTGKDKLIPHALDGIASNILVQDLALARPFAEVAARACFPDKPEVVDLYQNHVFVNYDQLFDSKDLSTIMTKWCAVEDIIEMDTEDNVEALQAGHSRSTENQVYGISVEALAGAAEDILPAYLNASMEWQRHCQVPLGGQSTSYKKAHLTPPPPQAPIPEQREQPNKRPVAYSMPAEEVDRVADAVVKRLPSTDDIAAKVMEKLMPALKGMLQEVLQSSTCHQGQSEKRDKGKGKETSTSHGEPDQHPGPSDQSLISMPRPAQQVQAANTGKKINSKFKSIVRLSLLSRRPRQDKQPVAYFNPQISTTRSPASDAALQAMQALLRNPKATWRSKEQHACMVSVLEGQNDLIAVLGTGAGKSMLATVPSITQPDRATILVLPLNSLVLDYQQCLEEWRVPHQVYVQGKPLNSSTNLILVTADRALTSQWREALALVLLSATLPPWCIEEAKSTFQLVSRTKVIQQCTNQPELSYHLERVPSDLLQDRVMEVLDMDSFLWEERDRGLVFVMSVAAGQSLAQKTAYPFYNGNKETTDEEQQLAYHQWINGRTKVLIATTAFSAGNDYPHVRMGRAGQDEMDNQQAAIPSYLQHHQCQTYSMQGWRERQDGLSMNCYIAMGQGDASDMASLSSMMGKGWDATWMTGNEGCLVCLSEPGHEPRVIQVAGIYSGKLNCLRTLVMGAAAEKGAIVVMSDSHFLSSATFLTTMRHDGDGGG
ncbi:hypothetical protein EDC04DRAFT_2600382 [Pisolithus marmoratus]|nr:hypothetical protein EDC04DRAFT_2600382 [Pisolithus marmoratus]